LVQKDVLEALISEEASVPLLGGFGCLVGVSSYEFVHINSGEGEDGLPEIIENWLKILWMEEILHHLGWLKPYK